MKENGIQDGVVQNEARESRAEMPGNSRKSWRVLDGVTELYRHYDADGILLYVGISLNTVHRLMHHRTVSTWRGQISRIEIQRFPTRDDAVEAERKAIRVERPIYNRAGKPSKTAEEIDAEVDLIIAMDEMTAEDWAGLRAGL